MLSLGSTDDEDSGDEEVCLYCHSSKFSYNSVEEWCKCTSSDRWVQFLCAGVEGDGMIGSNTYTIIAQID